MNTRQHFQSARVGSAAAGLVALWALTSAGEVHAAMPGHDLMMPAKSGVVSDSASRIEVADAVSSGEAGPDQAAKPPAKPDTADPKVAARETTCKSQWTMIDTNGDGLVDDGEVQRYNDSVRAENQPVLADTDRLTETDFMKSCLTLAAHE